MARDNTETFVTANVAPVRITALGGREHFPQDCPHCREKVTSWPLGVYNSRVGLICPHCFTIAARVEVIEPGERGVAADALAYYIRRACNPDEISELIELLAR